MRSQQHRSNPLACHKRVTIITSREFQTGVSNRQPWFSNWEAERARPAIIREHSNAFGKETLMRQWQSLQGWQVAEHAISKGQAVPCWGELLNFWETRFRKICKFYCTCYWNKMVSLLPAEPTSSMHHFSRKSANSHYPLSHQPEV